MKDIPLLDRRDRQTVLRQLREIMVQYVPELHLNPTNPGAADALVELFGGMLYETINHFNRVPYKKFLYFMNLCEVLPTPATPATGIQSFSANKPDARGATVPKGTRLLANDPAGGDSIVFCTESAFDAVCASITQLILVNSSEDCIEKPLITEEVEFFRAHPEHNLQVHRFLIGHNALLSRDAGACDVELLLSSAVEQLTQETAVRLGREDVAMWEFFDGEDWCRFERVEVQGQHLYLHKGIGGAMLPSEDEILTFIRCTVIGNFENIRLQEVSLRPMLPKGRSVIPDELFFNDQPIDPVMGGYCFGRYPVAYDCFYISADTVFSKRGAVILLTFDVGKTVLRQMTQDYQYNFNKMIIEKNTQPPTPEEIYISQVVWEYWNGIGWRRLETEKSENPFACRREGSFDVTFICPPDLQEVPVNSVSHLWIRARAALIENSISMYGDRMLPYIKSLHITYTYESLQKAEAIRVENGGMHQILDRIANVNNLDVEIYQALEPGSPAVYIAFDRPFCGYPVNIYFELSHARHQYGSVEVQALTSLGFRKVHTVDQTDGLAESGVLSLYLSESPTKATLFGVEGYFIRLLGVRRADESCPKVSQIIVNAVEIRETRQEDEVFSVDPGEIGLEIQLAHVPVLSCQVWVSESADGVEVIPTQWQQVGSLADSSADSRVYRLDAVHGRLLFGDGLHGMLVPPGNDAVHVSYVCGGGSRANLAKGTVNQMARSITYITQTINVTATCGGSDWQNAAMIERLGPRRMRHGFRACCPGDYEDLVKERFGEVARVRCYPNTSPEGFEHIGMVTVAVEMTVTGDSTYAARLCRRIRTMLGECCDCMTLDSLYVIPATQVTINVSAWMTADDYAYAAEIEQSAEMAIDNLLRPGEAAFHQLGVLPMISEFFAILKKTSHVRAVRDVSVEAAYNWAGEARIVDMDELKNIPFAIAKSGVHKIRL